MNLKKVLLTTLMFVFMIGCTGKAIETNTPDTLPDTSETILTYEDGKYVVKIEEDLSGVIQEVDEDGNVVSEEEIELSPEDDGDFSVHVEFASGEMVVISGRVIDDSVFEYIDVQEESGEPEPTPKSAVSFDVVVEQDDTTCGVDSEDVLVCWETDEVESTEEDNTFIEDEDEMVDVAEDVEEVVASDNNIYVVDSRGMLSTVYKGKIAREYRVFDFDMYEDVISGYMCTKGERTEGVDRCTNLPTPLLEDVDITSRDDLIRIESIGCAIDTNVVYGGDYIQCVGCTSKNCSK